LQKDGKYSKCGTISATIKVELLALASMDSEDASFSTSEAVTEGIRVSVRACYSAEHSSPHQSEWFFLYTVTIANESDQTVTLLNRNWLILDATGKSEEVHGPGVIGEQPALAPGQAFEYTSGCPLSTPFGSMSGSYEMSREDGTRFEAEVRVFQLRQPNAIH
jgi:ApaG protein